MINLVRSLPRRVVLALGVAAVLSGCGTAPDTGFGTKETLALAKAAVTARAKPAAGGIAVIDIPAQTLAEWPEPLIVAASELTGASSALGRIARNGGDETYSSADANHVTLRQGMVVSTRGLGVDLMASSPPTRAAIAAVLNPQATSALFFVADGKGGHVFADTLQQHNANVIKWYAIRRERGEM